jgi:hypothetical protein
MPGNGFNEMGLSSDNAIEECLMDWQRRFRTDENELKALIDRLGQGPAAETLSDREREVAFRSIGQKLVEMRAYADDCLSGRDDHEKAVLELKLRIEFPLFAHLSSLSIMPREYVEWSCA